jgi:hypothetical protein
MKTTTEKASYTLKFAAHDQDNLNIIDFRPGDDFPKFLDYDSVLKFSIEKGYIENESEINCLVDGSDHIEPYFTSNSAAEETANYLENDFAQYEKYFSAMEHEYELF